MAYSEFALTVAIAAVVWSAFYYTLGSVLGKTGPLILALVADVLDDIPRWLLVLGLVILLASAGLGATTWRIRQRRLRRQRRLKHLRHLRRLRHPRQESTQMSDDVAGQGQQTICVVSPTEGTRRTSYDRFVIASQLFH